MYLLMNKAGKPANRDTLLNNKKNRSVYDVNINE